MASISGKSNVAKRKREENWSEQDKIFMVNLIQSKIQIIEDKQTDINNHKTKLLAWKQVSENFNMIASYPRAVDKMREQWKRIKQNAKKYIFAHQRAASPTGGGTNEKRVSELDWLVYSLVSHSFFEDSSQYDSDGINLTAQNSLLNSGQDKQNDMGQIDSQIVNTFETGSPIHVLQNDERRTIDDQTDNEITIDIAECITENRPVRVTASGSNENRITNQSVRRGRRRLAYQSEADYHKLLMKKKEEEYALKFQFMREKHEAEMLLLAAERERVKLEEEKIKLEILILKNKNNIV
ncbi:hypothetical protein EVAR_6872_1 [Eumeta japonica]|uniref:Regulatory protein zeste n=1 Tax=Eumeta variegata TaxID=151549 RepID=A0A4C1TJD8_EUMVA|nr:hypothetical protein EVAR_6872_1 [Eumeta japonica]